MLIDLTVTVNPMLNVIESHRITEEIEQKLIFQHQQSIILVHIEPNLTN